MAASPVFEHTQLIKSTFTDAYRVESPVNRASLASARRNSVAIAQTHELSETWMSLELRRSPVTEQMVEFSNRGGYVCSRFLSRLKSEKKRCSGTHSYDNYACVIDATYENSQYIDSKRSAS